MTLEIDAYKRLTKGLRLSPIFAPKKAVGKKEKDRKKESKSVTAVSDAPKKVVKADKAVKSETSVKSEVKSQIPLDMKPSPIGLSNTSALPPVNLGGMGTRSKQFKGQ